MVQPFLSLRPVVSATRFAPGHGRCFQGVLRPNPPKHPPIHPVTLPHHPSPLLQVPVSALINNVLGGALGADPTKTLIELNLAHHGLGELGGQALAKALESFDGPMQALIIPDNWLGDRGGAAVIRSLMENKTIKIVDISKNNMGRRGAEAVGEMLDTNKTVVDLNLSSNGFLDGDAVTLAAGIERNFTVTKLNLSYNAFESGAGAIFGPALESNHTLVELDLSWNQFRLDGGQALCASLTNHSSINRLHLGYNGLADAGACALASALGDNSALEYVDLSNNRIETDGCTALATALACNSALKTIKLTNNPLGDEGVLAWVNCLMNENKSLLTLDMKRVTHTAETSAKVVDMLKKSSELQGQVRLLGEATRNKAAATEQWEVFAARKEATTTAKAAYDEVLAEKKWDELGASLGRVAHAEAALAKTLGPQAAGLWRNISTIDHRTIKIAFDNGEAVYAAREACVTAVVGNPNDSETPITAAYTAYVAVGGASAVEDAAKFSAGFSALSGVCANDAAIAVYAATVQSSGSAAMAAEAANAAFTTLFGPAFISARLAFAAMRSAHPNDLKKAVAEAQVGYAENNGNAAFDPVAEVAEMEALDAAKVAYLQGYPDTSKLSGDMLLEAIESCSATALREYKEALGKEHVQCLPKLMGMQADTREYKRLSENTEITWKANLDACTALHTKASEAEKATRDAELSEGKRPDFDLKLDFSLNATLTAKPEPNMLDYFLEIMEERQTTPFQFYQAIDNVSSGVITRERFVDFMTEQNLAQYAERIADLIGLADAGITEDDEDKEEGKTTAVHSPIAIDYQTFMRNMWANTD